MRAQWERETIQRGGEEPPSSEQSLGLTCLVAHGGQSLNSRMSYCRRADGKLAESVLKWDPGEKRWQQEKGKS